MSQDTSKNKVNLLIHCERAHHWHQTKTHNSFLANKLKN